MPYDLLRDWVQARLSPNAYQYVMGDWVDREVPPDAYACVISAAGGSAPLATDRRPVFTVWLLGPRQSPGAASRLLDDMSILMGASVQGIIPCGVANIRAMAEPTGPGRTTENRVWVSVNFEVVY